MIKRTPKEARDRGKWATKERSKLKCDAGLLCDMNIIRRRSSRAWWKHLPMAAACRYSRESLYCRDSDAPARQTRTDSTLQNFLSDSQSGRQTNAVNDRSMNKLKKTPLVCFTHLWISINRGRRLMWDSLRQVLAITQMCQRWSSL